MNKEYSIKGTFYLKSGAVIEKEIIIDNENPQKVIEDLRQKIKIGFNNNCHFMIVVGNTIFRGDDISAVNLVENF